MEVVVPNVGPVGDEELLCGMYQKMTPAGRAKWIKMGIATILSHPSVFFDEDSSPPRQQDDSDAQPQPYKLRLALSA